MVTIQAQVLDNFTQEVLMDRIFSEDTWLSKVPLTIEAVMQALDTYIVGEHLQEISEIKVRVRINDGV